MMRLLDLFCGGGGAGMGYHLAGFEVVGVDIKPQPHYPFEFHQGDALEYLAEHYQEFDVIHTSPKCQAFSVIQNLAVARNGSYPKHEDLISQTRKQLKATGKPYIIENVPGSPLINAVTLCGTMFNLKVIRHRLFETNPTIWFPPFACSHDTGGTPSAGNGKSPKGFISVCGSGGIRGMKKQEIIDYWSMAMGIDWMTRPELSQAIPPAYTEWIGQQLMKSLGWSD